MCNMCLGLRSTAILASGIVAAIVAVAVVVGWLAKCDQAWLGEAIQAFECEF